VTQSRTIRSPDPGPAITREGEWFVAQCLEVDVASQGASPEEALANLREALELYDEPTLAAV